MSDRRTALTAHHEAAGARMASFAGWTMPIEFTGTLSEHHAVRESVGAFDVSHLGTVLVSGPGADEVVGRSFTLDPGRVAVGASQYTLCCTEAGGVVDDLITYRLADDRWMLVPNAANTAAVVARLHDVAGRVDAPAEVDDVSADRAIMAVQGPDALPLAGEVLGVDVTAIEHLRLQVTDDDVLIVRTGYTGESGCEVVVAGAQAVELWQRLLDAGATPCGLGARDTLRLEMGYPLHGHELSEDVSPYEARMGWAVKLDHEFVGRDALAAAKEAGPGRRLWGVRVDGRRPLRDGMAVRLDGDQVGRLTSGGFSPTLQAGIGLGLLDDPVGPGDEVVVDVRGRDVPATVVRPPFVDHSPKA